MYPELKVTLIVLLGTLTLASACSWFLGRNNSSPTLLNLKSRVNSWWMMVAVFFGALAIGPLANTVLFGLVSFLALREFITLTPTSRADHRPLFWAFFVITPIQYLLVAMQWYGLASIFIPVYAFVLIPIRRALAGDHRDFLSSVARIQWGLLVCVYFVSHLPLILQIPISNFDGKQALLLLFLVVCVQASDVFQYVWGKLCGKRKIAPSISPSKTVAGFVGGIGTTVVLSMAFVFITPFTWWQAPLMALIVCLAGFCGGLVMSAIKRDLGVKDWGDSIPGHGGFLDRIDSLCFAAPLFFHLVNFFFSPGIGSRPPIEIWQNLPGIGQF